MGTDINARKAFLVLFAGDTGEIKPEVRNQSNAKVAKWREEGKVEIIPGVHILDIEPHLGNDLAPLVIMARNGSYSRDNVPQALWITCGRFWSPAHCQLPAGEDMEQIIQFWCQEEDASIIADATSVLTSTATQTVLRYSLNLISCALILAWKRKAK
ncbi:hypothetical protein ARMGADRAFT_1072557 [Armillaria gallica]|uniref:RuvB-like helicase n=1 Tax=Armillaria gallica TaxID=47427 RepID=A0A2H3DYA0_ARMGA|nr:hypothetical protein ARMGADRAFT_1072557 [Armillaria gallica]